MKIADCHMHSFFSSDSEAPTEEMVKRAVELGLPAICLTDHYDICLLYTSPSPRDS